ncbi:hypothetical protein CLOP_g21494 [Closterium sp. NIES-67]|nr:hypothetical protein CLOP_g21494 [Closterium sp. NIES-67]
MSPRQFEALTAICDTLVCALPVPTETDDLYFPLVGKRKEGSEADENPWSEFYGEPRRVAIAAYFAESASSLGLVDKVAATMQHCLKPLALGFFKTILWLLTTRLGTLLLAGRRALTPRPPFLQPFPKLSPQAREAVLLRWSVSRNFVSRTIFKTFRSFTLFHLGAQDDGSGDNKVWRAMGYCGPDPNMPAAAGKQDKCGSSNGQHCSRDSSAGREPDVAQRPAQRSDSGEGKAEPEEGTTGGGEARPLDDAVVDCSAEGTALAAALQGKGVEVLAGPKQTIGLLGRRDKGGGEPVVVRCDAVVIGSGCGGAIIAAQLAEAAAAADGADGSTRQRRVLVLEAGGYFYRSDLSLLEAPSAAELYDTQGFLTTEDGGVALLAGKAVGGGSTVNWSASFRTPPHVTKEWADEYGLKQFESPEYASAMDSVCDKIQVTADEAITPHSLSNAALKAGCSALSLHHAITPRNTNQPHSCGWCTFGCWSGEKQSMLETWLPDAVTHGALILSRCSARRLLLSPNRAASSSPGSSTAGGAVRRKRVVGVEARIEGGGESGPQRIVVEADLVVVACGSLRTPPLLLASGLTSRAIGASLRLHPVTSAWGFFPEAAPSLPSSLPPGPGYVGPIMSVNSREVANWESTGYGAMIQTPTMHPGLLGCAVPWLGSALVKQSIARFDRTASLIAIVRDRGHGTVGMDGSGRPVVSYRLCKEDQKSMQDALLLSLRILRAAGAVEVGTLHQSLKPFRCLIPPADDARATSGNLVGSGGPGETHGWQCSSDAEFEAYLMSVAAAGFKLNDCTLFSAHQTGSCPMGTSLQSSVVDENGESWEVSGLFLGDGSVFPTPVGVNPMVSIESVAFMIGKRLADKVRNGYLCVK